MWKLCASQCWAHVWQKTWWLYTTHPCTRFWITMHHKTRCVPVHLSTPWIGKKFLEVKSALCWAEKAANHTKLTMSREISIKQGNLLKGLHIILQRKSYKCPFSRLFHNLTDDMLGGKTEVQLHSCQPVLGVNLICPEFVTLYFSYADWGLSFFHWWQRHFEFQLARVAVEGRSDVLNMHAQLQISLLTRFLSLLY